MCAERLRLTDGARIAVIGGGPSGSFFTLYLLKYAQEAGLKLQVDVFQERLFSRLGPRGCKGCAGVLSASLLANMRELDLQVPERVIQSRITCYRLFSLNGVLEVCNPEPEREILSVYRGGGPRLCALDAPISFDDFLLHEAQKRGANVIYKRVRRMSVTHRPTLEVEDRTEDYDAAVVAAGLNTLPLQLPDATYRAAVTHQMVQDELHARREDIEAYLGTKVQVFFLPGEQLTFGTLIPKGTFINVSLLGKGRTLPSMDSFLAHPLVRIVLPFPYQRACGCRPRIAIGSSRGLYADRFLAIGDGQTTRFYKDGIGSALQTGRQAAYTMVFHGISRLDFERHYVPVCRRITRDNRAGQFLFRLNDKVKDSAAFFAAHSKLAGREMSRSPRRRPFNYVIWGMFTGSYSYRRILAVASSPVFLARLFGAVAFEAVRTRIRPQLKSQLDEKIRLRVLVLGGGFAGVHTTLRLERALRRAPRVDISMVSKENFFLFTPFLHEVATGGIDTRHIAYPYRQLRGRRRFNFLQQDVRSVDLARKKVMTNKGELPYDYLVLALGSTTDTTSLPAATRNIFALKTLADGIFLRNHIIEMFEQADLATADEQKGLLTFVVVGGGYTGVQLIAEMRDFIHGSLIKNYPNVKDSSVRLLLVQGQERILPDFDEKLSAFAYVLLRRQGVEVKLNSQVTKLRDDGLELNGSEDLDSQTVVWVVGVRANPVTSALPVEKDDLGRVKVNEYLEVPGFPGVYALGDNAHVKDVTGQPLPPTAHIAVRQPKVAAANILADLRGKPKRPFRTTYVGRLVSLGAHSAVLKLYGLRVYGWPARFIWGVAYLSIMAGRHNRTKVAMDWWLALNFGRDTTLLRLSRTERPQPGNGQGKVEG